MRKQDIIFFYSHEKEKALVNEFCPDTNVLFSPLDQSFKKKKIDTGIPLIIIYDSSKGGKSLNKLKDIKYNLPQSPLLLLVKNPTKEYLMAALNYRVSAFFQLPVKNEKVIMAINKILKQQKKGPLLKVIWEWLRLIPHLTQSLIRGTVAPFKQYRSDLKNLEKLGIAPHNLLPFIGQESESDNAYDLNVQFFGPLRVKIRGKTVPNIKGKKNTLVLAYLLFNHHKSVHRDVLIDRFWSDVNMACAKNSLNVAICNIRKDLAKVLQDQEVILYENESYCINTQLEIITDVEKFKYFWKKGRAIEASQGLSNALHAYNKAVALYQEEFLGNLRYEDWCESERANLREIYLFILNRLSAYFFEQKNYYACINICKKMLSTDECLEEVYRKLMKCYYALGLTDIAFKQYFKCKKVLEEELALQPSKPTIELFEKIQNGKTIF